MHVIDKTITIMLLFIQIIIFHVINVFFVQTAFVPDEYWQSVEVSHKYVFGRGHLTWEWKHHLRSFFHPGIFSLIFKMIESIGLDNTNLIVLTPKLFQASLSAFGDWCFVKFAQRKFGMHIANWVLFFQTFNWFWKYCACRTLINSFETSLIMVGMRYYTGFDGKGNNIIYMCIAVLLSIVRPTSFITWLPLVLLHLLKSLQNKKIISTLLAYCLVSIALTGSVLYIDFMFYKKLTFPPFNFFKFNFLDNKASLFGTHPWHWYFSQGIWVVFGPQYLLCVYSFYLIHKLKLSKNEQSILKMSLFLININVLVYSLLGHKEFRFILPIVPFASLLSAFVMQNVNLKLQKIFKYATVIINLCCFLYFSLIHQRGTLDVVKSISARINKECETFPHCSVLFLMPCHSTPFYSHIHLNIPMKFLECQPNFSNDPNYKNEQEIFYGNPSLWLQQNVFIESVEYYTNNTNILPKYITFFSSFIDVFQKQKHSKFYTACDSFFHTHFPEGNQGFNVELLCRI